jgi:hypothetical protein
MILPPEGKEDKQPNINTDKPPKYNRPNGSAKYRNSDKKNYINVE